MAASRQSDWPQGRMAEHNRLVAYLDDIAVLAGCVSALDGQLPDGSRPDVARYEDRRGLLFLGDAKYTETPGCQETRTRLLGYMRWLKRHVSVGKGPGIFALCFETWDHVDGWKRMLQSLLLEVGLGMWVVHHSELGPGVNVVWVAVVHDGIKPAH